MFELGARFGRPLITALARLDGRPVGVLASDPEHYGGGLTADASDKLARFVDLCDQFHLPVANFVDQPGFVIGTESERAGTIRRGARALFAVYQATRARGSRSWCARSTASPAPATATAQRLNLRYAWPSGDWGSLPIAGGLEAAYRRELEARRRPGGAARRDRRRASTRCARRSAPPSASASRRSSTRATRARCCATGPRGPTSWSAHELAAGPKARGLRP